MLIVSYTPSHLDLAQVSHLLSVCLYFADMPAIPSNKSMGCGLKRGKSKPGKPDLCFGIDVQSALTAAAAGQYHDLEPTLRAGFGVIGQLFKALDCDGCLTLSWRQCRRELEARGLQEATLMDKLWTSTIDRDHDGRVCLPEFIHLVYMWAVWKVGSYLDLFRAHVDRASAVKATMDALTEAFQKYSGADGGRLSQEQAELFLREQLPGAEASVVPYFFPTPDPIRFSQFLVLVFTALGGSLEAVGIAAPAKQSPPPKQPLPERVGELYDMLEADFDQLAHGGSTLTLYDLLSEQEHKLVPGEDTVASHLCSVCECEATHMCPYPTCQFYVCGCCYKLGIISHRTTTTSAKDNCDTVEWMRRVFTKVDEDRSGSLDFFQFVVFAFLACDEMSYCLIDPSSRDAARVKMGLLYISKVYHKYGKDKTLSWDVVKTFCKDAFEGKGATSLDSFTQAAKGGKTLNLLGFHQFLYCVVRPKGRHAADGPPAPKPQPPPELVTITPRGSRKPLPKSKVCIAHVDMKKVRLGRQLGRGAQSIVHEVTYEGIAEPLVAKMPLSGTSPQGLKDMVSTAKLQMQFKHENILHVVGVHEEPVCILLELCQGGDVQGLWRNVIPRPGCTPIAPPLQWQLAAELASALATLHAHSPPFIHRDLKGANCFLDEDRHLKLADFDCAVLGSSEQLCGTPGFIAPEVLTGRTYDHHCDVFAYASVLYEITHACYPYSREHTALAKGGALGSYFKTIKDLMAAKIMPQISPSLPAEFQQLMRDCWAFSPDERPSMADVNTRVVAMKHLFP